MPYGCLAKIPDSEKREMIMYRVTIEGGTIFNFIISQKIPLPNCQGNLILPTDWMHRLSFDTHLCDDNSIHQLAYFFNCIKIVPFENLSDHEMYIPIAKDMRNKIRDRIRNLDRDIVLMDKICVHYEDSYMSIEPILVVPDSTVIKVCSTNVD